jgi:hypothetical protein
LSRILTRVSHVVRFNACHSKTHSSIAGYASSSYRDVPVPHPSQTTVHPSQLSAYSSLAPSPVPTLSRGCRYLPIAHQELLTHLLPLAKSLSPEPRVMPTTPAVHPHPQLQLIADQDVLNFGFPALAENTSLPAANSTLAHNQTYGECKRTSSGPNLTGKLTICDIVWPQFPPLDPPSFNYPSFCPTIVSDSIISGSDIPLHEFIGCRRT